MPGAQMSNQCWITLYRMWRNCCVQKFLCKCQCAARKFEVMIKTCAWKTWKYEVMIKTCALKWLMCAQGWCNSGRGYIRVMHEPKANAQHDLECYSIIRVYHIQTRKPVKYDVYTSVSVLFLIHHSLTLTIKCAKWYLKFSHVTTFKVSGWL